MKLNKSEITIAEFEESVLDDELIIFVKEYHKIIVLNQTAATILKYLLLCYETNLDVDTSDIKMKLLTEYKDSVPNDAELTNDINETIQLFFESSLLLV